MHRVEITTPRTAIIYWFFTVGYMGIIFYFSSLEKIDMIDLPQNSDKFIHLCAYLLLAFLANLSLYKSGVKIKKYVFMFAFLIATLYGITDEFHQAFVPGRDASIGDVIADSIGAFLGSFSATRIIR